jgi:hypothetical protein
MTEYFFSLIRGSVKKVHDMDADIISFGGNFSDEVHVVFEYLQEAGDTSIGGASSGHWLILYIKDVI